MVQYTVPSHFIRYTFIVMCCAPFAFWTVLIPWGTDLTRCWERSSEVLIHMDMINHTVAADLLAKDLWRSMLPMKQISHSITPQRYSSRLELCLLWKPFEYIEPAFILMKPVWMISWWCIILLEAAIYNHTVVINTRQYFFLSSIVHFWSVRSVASVPCI